MATAYYTDAYNNKVLPDGNVPLGKMLTQFTSFVGKTSGHGSGDTFYMVKLPAGAILSKLVVEGPAITSGRLAVGTTATVSTPSSATGGYSDVSAAATTIISAAELDGIWKVTLNGGYQGTAAITQTTCNGTVRAGSLMQEETGIYMTFSSGYMAADDVIFFSVDYFMGDGGQDMVYDPG
jgi:hypothetical protein